MADHGDEGGGLETRASSGPAPAPRRPPELDAFFAGIASVNAAPQVDTRVPGVPRDVGALMPWIDPDVGGAAPPATPASSKRGPVSPKASGPKGPAAETSPAAEASPAAEVPATGAVPADFEDKLAAMKASAIHASLILLGDASNDRNRKYEIFNLLENTDALTRTKLKDQFEAQNNGATLASSLATATWHGGDRDKENALDLISDRRDAASAKLEELAERDPKAREAVEDKAAAWADKVLRVTRADDRDDSEKADEIASVLGQRSPQELELIRARIRKTTSGTTSTTLYEELDRTFTKRDKNIALSGLKGDHVHVASTQLVDAAAEGDPERVHSIVKQLGPEKLIQLHASDPLLAGRIITGMPADKQDQISAAMRGRQDAADGARIAALFQPVEISTKHVFDGTAGQKLKQREAQDPERVIEELGRHSPAELDAARNAWDGGGHDKTWDQMIADRFPADSTIRHRIEAAARGDKVGERAFRLRQGMKTFDQNLIDQALSNPDLASDDPKKKQTAEASQRALGARMQLMDANEQHVMALAQGTPGSERGAGRGLDDQLAAHYEKAKVHDTGPSGGFLARVADKSPEVKAERMAKVSEKATVDQYAASEMWEKGSARASTQVRRAELTGNTLRKAEILENLDSSTKEGSTNTLDAQAAEYQRKFGKDMLAAPDTSAAEDAVKALAPYLGTDEPVGELAKRLVREDMNVGELRLHHVRETGVLADRTKEERLAQQKEVRALSQSGWLGSSEDVDFRLGRRNRGSEDWHQSTINVMERSVGEGVGDRELARQDRSATQALELQREEKQREAAKVAQMLMIASKIAAIATMNPALFVAVDAGFSILRMAAQELIANEAYDVKPDAQHAAVDLIVNIATLPLGGLGQGVEAGTAAAKSVRAVQTVGNAGAAVGGAAAHSAIDGGDSGGAEVRAGVSAVAPRWARGKTENLIKGRGTRAIASTLVEGAANLTINGGQGGDLTAIDAVGNTIQGRNHGGARVKARPHEYAQMARRSGGDLDHLRRTTTDSLRHAPATEHHDPRYARIDEHARDVHPATTAFGHYADDNQDATPRYDQLSAQRRRMAVSDSSENNTATAPKPIQDERSTPSEKATDLDASTLSPGKRPWKPPPAEGQVGDQPTARDIRRWADQTANAAPKPTAEQLHLEKDRYEARQAEVRSNYEKAMNGTIEPPGGVSKERLRLAVEGDPTTGERVPLTFKDADQLHEFQADLRSVLAAHGIDDATIQQLGSGTTGWRGNPNKEIAGWKPTSDTDFAIFSNQALAQARDHGVPANREVTQGGKYTVLKNDIDHGVGFYDTPVGVDLEALALKWNKIVYGSETAQGFDFKMNLSDKPFGRATTIVAPPPSRKEP